MLETKGNRKIPIETKIGKAVQEVIHGCMKINLHVNSSQHKKSSKDSEIDKVRQFAFMSNEEKITKQEEKLGESKILEDKIDHYLENPKTETHFRYANELFKSMKSSPNAILLWIMFWPLVDFMLILLLMTFFAPFIIFLGTFGGRLDFLFHSTGMIGLICSLFVQALYWHHQMLEMAVEYSKDSCEWLSKMKERLDNRFDWKTATHGTAKMVMDSVARSILAKKGVGKWDISPEVPKADIKNQAVNKLAEQQIYIHANIPLEKTHTKHECRLDELMKSYPNVITLWLMLWPLADGLIVLLLMISVTPFLTFFKTVTLQLNFLLHSMPMVGLLCSLFVQTLFWHHQMLEMVADSGDIVSGELSEINQRFKNRIYVKTATHT